MLIELRSDRFRAERIAFHEGLNVVLGDDNATNSIGKSSLLMVIDFAYGGKDLLFHNKDIVEELGHHDYYITFRFDEEFFRFRRGTEYPDIVYECDSEYEMQKSITVEEYTAFLKASYRINIEDISFRSFVGLYVRVWGKDNLNVYKPLHIIQAMPGADCVNNLIKTFNRYIEIKGLIESLKKKEDEKSALRNAIKNQIVPKIGKKEYKANEERISCIESEIIDIKNELASYAANISQLVNREALELKNQKDQLMGVKLKVQSKLSRIKKNILENRHVKSKYFDDLVKFFPEVNKERLVDIEEFHSSVARLLKIELREAEAELEAQVSRIDNEVSLIDSKMKKTLASVNEPTQIVDRIVELSGSLNSAKEENEQYESQVTINQDISVLKESLADEKNKVISLLQDTINDGISRIVESVFGRERKSPIIQIKGKNYSYEVFEDTGTGTAYAGLIVFDLAIFKLTIVPFIVHDSLLFKNIENDSVANLFRVYSSVKKQSFVAIDEINKYGEETSLLLREKSVIQLDDNNVLYVKDWRK